LEAKEEVQFNGRSQKIKESLKSNIDLETELIRLLLSLTKVIDRQDLEELEEVIQFKRFLMDIESLACMEEQVED